MKCFIVLNLLSCRWLLAVISDDAQFLTAQYFKLSEIMMLWLMGAFVTRSLDTKLAAGIYLKYEHVKLSNVS